MTLSQQTPPTGNTAGPLSCLHCKAVLPAQATFCGSCGERLQKQQQTTHLEEQDIRNRYRLKTLIRRYPHANLYFALDNDRSQAMVAMRDIDIARLEKGAREQAVVLAHQEYDCLRRWRLPHTLACLDLRVFQGHLFLVSGLPGAAQEPTGGHRQQLWTLQDFLQSGQGLPGEARALAWVRNLGQAVEHLHRHHIILGDLDPSTIVLTQNSAQADPLLMISWLWPDLRKLLPESFPISEPQSTAYKAPEVLAGKISARADVYSLGALLYLLLTGTLPDESALRLRQSLRAPREINARLGQHLDDCVMRALAVEPEERFPGVMAFLTALEHARANRSPRKVLPSPLRTPETALCEMETVRMAPLVQRDGKRRNATREEHAAHREASARTARPLRSLHVERESTHAPARPRPEADGSAQSAPAISSPLPITPLPGRAASPVTGHPPAAARNPITPPPLPDAPRHKTAAGKVARRSVPLKHGNQAGALLKQVQRLMLGQPKHTIKAAAIIETPQRIRPDQPYNLRLRIMGRDEPVRSSSAAPRAGIPAGLSALARGGIVQVEVRSVLQQGYTCILQRACVAIPAGGYTVEITIPMQQQTIVTTSRRERLHIVFLDEQRHPLYDRPFVVELFVSPLVQFGREGHQVLTIPI